MAVTLDILEGHHAEVSMKGWTVERLAIVTGLTGDADAKIYNASTVSGMPLIGASHPTIPYCKLERKVLNAITTEEVRFRLIYTQSYGSIGSGRPTDTIQVGGGLQQEESNLDAGSNVMTVSYAYPSNYPASWGDFAGQTMTQGGLPPRLIPQHGITITKLEYINPAPKARTYIGTVNNGPWSLDTSAAARTWLCTGIIGNSDDAGQTYYVTYSFQYRPDTWDSTIVFIDPATGRPPPDASSGNGMETYQRYTMMNFNNLGL